MNASSPKRLRPGYRFRLADWLPFVERLPPARTNPHVPEAIRRPRRTPDSLKPSPLPFQVRLEEREHLLPPVHGLLLAIRRTVVIEEPVARTIVAMEFVGLSELL